MHTDGQKKIKIKHYLMFCTKYRIIKEIIVLREDEDI